MKKMMIAICDDDKYVHYLLQEAICYFMNKHEIEYEVVIYSLGKELISEVERFDLIFLDIVLPDFDGYEIEKWIREKNKACKIIIMSASGRRKEAFHINVFRFIEKPIKIGMLEEALQALKLTALGKELIKLYENRRIMEVRQNEIYYIEAYDSSTEFVVSGRKLRRDISLKSLTNILDKRIFIQINRKQMVNGLFITEYKDGILYIDNCEFRVSRRRKREVEQFLKEFKKHDR
ncbi:LytR/AlgR family response regulator transcription factor [Candidatus Galacturonibacter soehngenii]|uniref:Stage 0 sporulation protein A homolog n=1 Tax=Candidatus Galacturonatibacter soehngenii TaxID=2307010 RepID=A0A7V7QIA0_9FIRM|nr:LytTR family DNA-binding domain-containing protein [Candidatus Galacturonibacter soehngenii]KAB1435900.1 response regulator transcription factor [Candidatus Galacturonibacter soehngenii]